jgi:threonine dehydrogenase-like Zn-dependent dehydrogenase
MLSINIVRFAECLHLTAPGTLAWFTEELPSLDEHDVLVQTCAGAISIGSELALYCGTARASSPPRYPRNMGYENVGIVVACGGAESATRRSCCGFL